MLSRSLERLANLDWRLVFVAALTLHLAALAVRPTTFTRTENLRAGFTLAERGHLGDPFIRPTGPTAHLSPVYPALVAAAYSVTHDERDAVRILGVIGAFASALNAAMLLPLARRMRLPSGSGVLAAMLWICPLFPWIQLSGEHETMLTTTAVVVTLTIMFGLLERSVLSGRQGALLGAVTGIGSHFSPLVLPMVLLAVGAALLSSRPVIRVRRAFGLAFVASLLLVIAPYTIRNRVVMGSTFFIRDNLGLELAVSNGDRARPTAEANAMKGAAMDDHPFISGKVAARVRSMGEVAYNRARMREALQWIQSHPRDFLQITAQRAGYLALPHSPREYQRLIAALLSIGMLGGLVLLYRSGGRTTAATAAGAWLGYQGIYLFVQHDLRYVYPMLWVQSLVAASVPAMLLAQTYAPTVRRRAEVVAMGDRG